MISRDRMMAKTRLDRLHLTEMDEDPPDLQTARASIFTISSLPILPYHNSPKKCITYIANVVRTYQHTMSSPSLFELIKKSKWTAVVNRVGLFPEEASKPSTQSFRCGTTCRCLPIHNAVMRKPPKQVLLALASANPATLRTKDSLGRLPLHYAARFGASLELVKLLIALYPQGAAVTSDDGALPLMLACLYGDSIAVLMAIIDIYPDAVHKRDDAGLSTFEYASDNPRPIARQFMALILERSTSPVAARGHGGASELTNVRLSNLSLQPLATQEEMEQSDAKPSAAEASMETTQSASSEAKRRSSTKLCVVCLDKEVSQVLVPCGHTCLCSDCGSLRGLVRIELKCPECRAEVQQAVKIFARVVND